MLIFFRIKVLFTKCHLYYCTTIYLYLSMYIYKILSAYIQYTHVKQQRVRYRILTRLISNGREQMLRREASLHIGNIE